MDGKIEMVSRLELLKFSPYFSGLSFAELGEISHLLFEKRYDRGEMLLWEGEEATALYFIVAGVVKIFKTSADGKEQILAIIRPPKTFNEVPVFNGGVNPASAQAMTPLNVCGISRDNMQLILRQYCQVSVNIIQAMAERLRHLISLVEDLSFRHVIGRVARILLEHAGDGTSPGPRLTQQEMAAMAGSAREVVGRSLKTLEDEKIIRLDHHRVVITDKGALREMVEAPV